ARHNRALVGPAQHDGAGIRKNRGVQTGGNIRRDADTSFASETVNQFSSGAGCGIDPIDVRERAPAEVMIDADEKLLVEPIQPCTLDTVALQDDGRLIL